MLLKQSSCFQIARGEAVALEGVSLPEREVASPEPLFAGKLLPGARMKAVGCPGAAGVSENVKDLGEKPGKPGESEHSEGKNFPLGLSQTSRQNQGGGVGRDRPTLGSRESLLSQHAFSSPRISSISLPCCHPGPPRATLRAEGLPPSLCDTYVRAPA